MKKKDQTIIKNNTVTESKEPTNPIEVNINDTDRVKAALALAMAVRELATVIAGNTASVSISNCAIATTTTTPAISIKGYKP